MKEKKPWWRRHPNTVMVDAGPQPDRTIFGMKVRPDDKLAAEPEARPGMPAWMLEAIREGNVIPMCPECGAVMEPRPVTELIGPGIWFGKRRWICPRCYKPREEIKVKEKPVDWRAEYKVLVHAMQSGVGMASVQDGGAVSGETSPKHLRVGVNVALSDTAALARLLISKGVISEEEYLQTITHEMGHVVTRYEKEISELSGVKITLA